MVGVPFLGAVVQCLLAISAPAVKFPGQVGPPSHGSKKHYPKYARFGTNSDIETVWQRPNGDVRGIFFFAHGCHHQATDLWTDVGPDGWKFSECKSSNYKSCLGLPEEVLLRQKMRKKGYVVVAVSGGTGARDCWDPDVDAPRVKTALDHVRAQENLPHQPLILMGSSSGGGFMGELVLQDLENVSCVVPVLSSITVYRDYPLKVPALFIHMSRDKLNLDSVRENLEELNTMGVRADEVMVPPVNVSVDFLVHRGYGLTRASAEQVSTSLKETGMVDDDGFLKEDPRESNWREAIKAVSGLEDEVGGLGSDTSRLSELLNIAFGKHECVAYTDHITEFCELSWAGGLV